MDETIIKIYCMKKSTFNKRKKKERKGERKERKKEGRKKGRKGGRKGRRTEGRRTTSGHFAFCFQFSKCLA